MPDNLSLTGKRWILPGTCHAEDDMHPDRLAERLANMRGIDFADDGDGLGDPFAIHGMAKTVERIRHAIAGHERVGIFGDYDCDGITATALVSRALAAKGLAPVVRLPHRVRDGYGLRITIIDEFLAQNVTLLITVDSGITAHDEVEYAQSHGLDVIITDHHHVPQAVPNAYAIVHPMLAPAIPLPHPSGAGIAYQLIRALNNNDTAPIDEALAMIGTVADVMELKGVNRAVVRRGLRALAQLHDHPLAHLVLQSGIRPEKLTSQDIAFRIAPRINAAGRMQDPSIAFKALLEGGEALALLERLNDERQNITDMLFKELLARWKATTVSAPAAPVLYAAIDARFPEGITGLLAGKLAEVTGRPSMVGTVRGELCTASLRSIPAYHVTEGLGRCQDLLLSFGGHAKAAGCSFLQKNGAALITRMSRDIAARVNEDELIPTLAIDAELPPTAPFLPIASALERLQPFGEGNAEPLFLLRGIRIESPRRVGTDGAHLQARIAGAKAIGFRLGRFMDQTTHPVDAVCKIGIDSWNGRREAQVIVEDVRVARSSAVAMGS
ncbi:MAG: DHH family phosphoesterase [Candidatus Peribacteraceae bacterium]|nr:DHH family phosphoesterase [Candidatus Peribacteraceae bacterium]